MRFVKRIVPEWFQCHLPVIFITTVVAFCWGEVFQGTLQVRIYDKADGTVEYHDWLHIGHDRWKRLVYPTPENRTLYSATGEQRTFNRIEVRVEGTLKDNCIYVERLAQSTRSSNSAPPAREYSTKATEHTCLQILIGAEGSGFNIDPEDANNAIFGMTGRTTNAFYDACSFGTYKLVGIKDPNGDTYGPVNLSSCSNAASNARDRARQDGYPVDDYEVILHTYHQNTCGSGGVAGGRNANVFVALSALWDFASHEIGHCNVMNGLPHASSYRNCTSASGDVITFGGSCDHDEYGDMSDIMGGRNFMFCAYSLERLGWLPESNRLDVTESRRVTLYPIELKTDHIQTVWVPRANSDEYFNFEFRRPVSFDEGIDNGLTDGILVRIAVDPRIRSAPHILDMTPDNNFRDAALREGKTFRSKQDGDDIEVTTVEVTDEYTVIDIIIDGEPPEVVDNNVDNTIVNRQESRLCQIVLPGTVLLTVPLSTSEKVLAVDMIDQRGRVVSRMKHAGNGDLRWNTATGTKVVPGTYFFRFNTGKTSVMKSAAVFPH